VTFVDGLLLGLAIGLAMGAVALWDIRRDIRRIRGEHRRDIAALVRKLMDDESSTF